MHTKQHSKSKAAAADQGRKVVASNRPARARYEIEDVIEAGMMLLGTEIKSIRGGGANLRDSYADVRNAEIFLENCHIAPYAFGNRSNHDPLRSRKLLLRRREINKLIGKVAEKGYTLVPLEIYIQRGKAKVSLGVGKGKKTFDRREEIRRRDINREMQRELRDRR